METEGVYTVVTVFPPLGVQGGHVVQVGMLSASMSFYDGALSKPAV